MPKFGENYDVWKIKKVDFPKKSDKKDQLIFLLRYGILAPSALNTQPWKFEVRDDSIMVIADKSRHLKVSDPTLRDLFISIGCAITNILEAARSLSFKTVINLDKDTSSVKCAEIFVESKNGGSMDNSLIDVIPHRFSDRGLYNGKKIPEEILNNLTKISQPKKFSFITLVTDEKTKNEIINLAVEADKHFLSNSEFREEISSWLKPNFSGSALGMPGFTMHLNFLQSIIAPLLLRTSLIGNSKKFIELQLNKDKFLLKSSPCFGIISAKVDNKESWIKVGMLYEKLSLIATKANLRVIPLSAIIEYEKTRTNLKNLLSIELKPMMFFRLGYSNNKETHSPRLPIDYLTNIRMKKDTENNLMNSIGVSLQKGSIKIGPYDVNYVTAGKGKPLLLLHGGNIGWGQWYPNIAPFSKYFRVYALDLPGAGRSTKIDFSKLDLEKDFVITVEKFIQAKNLQKPNILGSSIGGWIALKLAFRRNNDLNKIILVDCIGFTDHMRLADRIMGITPIARLLTKTVFKPTPQNKNIEIFLRDVFYNKNLDIRREFIDYFYETMGTSHNLLLISRLSSFWGVRKEFELRNKLPKIKKEVMIIWGAKDKLMPPDKCYDNFQLIPNAQIEILEGVGHIPSLEKSEKFNELVINFLKT